MADTMTPEQRSACMSKIKGKDTKPELALRRALWAKGKRFRLRGKLPGIPDIVFSRQKTAVFVDGCFWHGCPNHCRLPKSNTDYWHPKIKANMDRDKRVDESLRSEGWTVVRIWEHEVKLDIEAATMAVIEALEAT